MFIALLMKMFNLQRRTSIWLTPHISILRSRQCSMIMSKGPFPYIRFFMTRQADIGLASIPQTNNEAPRLGHYGILGKVSLTLHSLSQEHQCSQDTRRL